MDHSQPRPEFFKAPLDIFNYHGMPYKPLGKSGLWVPKVGLGTWKFGMPETGDEARVNKATAMKIFDRALEMGVTLWDTAPRYNNASGNSERVIGAWLQANPDQRRNILIATKLYGGMDGLTPNHCRLTRANIKESVYASLERMHISIIDLLYFHHFDAITPPEESYSAIEDLVREDLVRYLAVSNYTIDQCREALRMEALFSARVRILAVQNQFDILRGEHPDYEGVLAFCADEGIDFIAYSPLAEGFLTDRYVDLSKVGAGDRIFDQGMLGELSSEENLQNLQSLSSMAQKLGIQLSQLVLAYTLTIPGMGPLIPAASSIEQLASNAAAAQIKLESQQRLEIKSLLGGWQAHRQLQ